MSTYVEKVHAQSFGGPMKGPFRNVEKVPPILCIILAI